MTYQPTDEDVQAFLRAWYGPDHPQPFSKQVNDIREDAVRREVMPVLAEIVDRATADLQERLGRVNRNYAHDSRKFIGETARARSIAMRLEEEVAVLAWLHAEAVWHVAQVRVLCDEAGYAGTIVATAVANCIGHAITTGPHGVDSIYGPDAHAGTS